MKILGGTVENVVHPDHRIVAISILDNCISLGIQGFRQN